MTLADEIRAWTRANERARDAYYEGPRTAINVRCACGEYTQARSGVCRECRKEKS